MSKTRYNIELIRWVDSESTVGWVSLRSLDHKTLECLSAGFVVAETDAAVTVVASITEKNDPSELSCCDPITIPKCAILSRKVIKKADNG